MWRKSFSFWEVASSGANIIAMVAGVTAATSALFSQIIIGVLAGLIAAMTTFISWYASKKASNIIQSESDERIAAAEEKAADANEKAEQERLERVRIEARLAPRSLSDTQALSDKLRPFGGTKITVARPFESGLDAVRLQSQIVSALKTAGWIVSTIEANVPGRYFEGVIVITSPEAENEIPDAANSLINELNADGVITTKGSRPSDAPDEITIIIGTKP